MSPPVINLSLVDNFVILLLFSRFIGGDGIPSTNGAEVASDERGPLLVVGASKAMMPMTSALALSP